MHDKDLDAEEIEECREAFNLFDSDADGHPNHQATSTLYLDYTREL